MKEIDELQAADITWRHGTARRCLRADSILSAEIGMAQGIPYEQLQTPGDDILQIPIPEWCRGAKPISQVQVQLDNGSVVTHTELAIWGSSGSRVVTRPIYLHTPEAAQELEVGPNEDEEVQP